MIIVSIIYLLAFVCFSLLSSIFTNKYCAQAMKSYKCYIFDKVLNKKINTFKNEVTSRYISNLTNDSTVIEENYIKNNFELINSIVTLCFGLVAMFYLNWTFAIVVILISFLPLSVSLLFGSRLGIMDRNVSEKNEGYVALIKDLLTGFTVIKNFKAEKEVYKLFARTNNELEEIKRRRKLTFELIRTISGVCNLSVSIVSFSLGAYLAIKGSITVGTVAAFVQLLNYVIGPVSDMGPLISNRKAVLELNKKIEESIIEEVNESKDIILEGFFDKIKIENLSFGFDKNIDILKKVSLVFEKGKSYAIVGASGSGKSTLLNLLLGYNDDFRGEILIDNHDLRKVKGESLYDIISVIQQNVFLFDACIRDNITMYKRFDSQKINSVIEKSGLKRVIEVRGEDYRCGENGCNLSGGEKQRISIARSLLKENKILLMDEATSALDNETAAMIEKSIVSLKDVTRIVVTHKLSANILKEYDEIIVLKNGSVVETGSFEKLYKKQNILFSIMRLSQ